MMKKLISGLVLLAMLACLVLPAAAAEPTALPMTVAEAVDGVSAYCTAAMQAAGTYSDWSILQLARSGNLTDAMRQDYLASLAEKLRACGGVLDKSYYTQYSRTILALTACGENARDFAGYDLTAPLANYDQTVWQGVNGAAFALIAMDSVSYGFAASGTSSRARLVAYLLAQELPGGGWDYSGKTADPDQTAMVLQALAPYQSNTAVKNAVSLGVQRLSKLQNDDGGYTSWGYTSSESCSQVVLTLCALGISMDDSRFVKNGHSVLDKLLTYQLSDGSFCHEDSYDAYATMQALCALSAAVRQQAGKRAFFTMTDAAKQTHAPQSGVAAHTAQVETLPAFSDISGHANEQAIKALAAYGIINGMTKTTYAPDAGLTRAQFAKIVVGSLGLTPEYRGTFKDVAEAAWYAPFVDTAAAYGIVNGVGDGKFHPDGAITVQEAATMTARAAALCGIDTALDRLDTPLSAYRDASRVSSWAKASVAYCVSSGLWASGEAALTPSRRISRGEIAQMLYGLLLSANLLQ